MDRVTPHGQPADADDGDKQPEEGSDDDQPYGEHDEQASKARGSDRGAASDTPLGKNLNTGLSPLPSLPMDPSSLRPLLDCTLCRRPLIVPTTLHCAHTLCAHHLSSHPSCPLPHCAPTATPHPNIPSSSTVAYYPPPQTAPVPPSLPPSSQSDFTINNVLDLLERVQLQLNQVDARPPTFKDDSDFSDDDAPHPYEPPATISTSMSRRRARSSSPGSPERPRKRRRRIPQIDVAEDPDGDLLAHLRTQSVRQRSTRHDQPLLPTNSPVTPLSRETILATFEKDLLIELTCEICLTLLYEPITTICQHTFCSRCLHRSLDYSPTCPRCRHDLPTYIHDHPINKVVLTLILQTFPAMYDERKETIEAEDRDARLDTPIFVCQLSFPGMPTILHFFEPRYRLMLRRCLESPQPCFGMVMAPKPGTSSPHTEYGTMLEIRSVRMQPDGRSLVETWGTYRFRVLERGTLDGYMVGRIERIDDDPEDLVDYATPVPDPRASSEHVPSRAVSTTSRSSASSSTATSIRSISAELVGNPSNAVLMARCRAFLEQLELGTAPWIVQRLSNTYGRIPTDLSSFSFWVASVLPIDEHEKAKLLPIRSARLRLLLVVHWVEQLNNNWWFSSGCVIL